nr:hypothetical protein [Tanacetum cinerariifolium]
MGRCNNYAVLQNIPCSPECKIIGQILLDHPLSYAFTTTDGLPVVYLQQFWRTVSKVPGLEETIKFMLNAQHVGYQDVIDKKFLEIPKRIKDDYHSIKGDIPLVSVYTTKDVHVRGMLILDVFQTKEISATDDFKEYETVFIKSLGEEEEAECKVSSSPSKTNKITIRRKQQSTTPILPLGDDRERDEVAEEEIDKMVDGDEDEESYASEFDDLVLNDDVDDSGTKLEPESHKEYPEKVNDDDVEIKKEKKDNENVEKDKKAEEIKKDKNDVEKRDKVVKEKDIDDDVTDSMENRKEQKQTPIPLSTRSPKNVSSSDKTVSKELTATISPTTTTTSKVSSTTKRKKQFISYSQRLYHEIRKVLDHCNKVVPDITFAKTKEMITQEMPCLVNLAVNKDRKVETINEQEMIAKEFTTHGPKMIKELF